MLDPVVDLGCIVTSAPYQLLDTSGKFASYYEQCSEGAETQPVILFAISTTYEAVAPILLFKFFASTAPEL
jgi:hypothetical protein